MHDMSNFFVRCELVIVGGCYSSLDLGKLPGLHIEIISDRLGHEFAAWPLRTARKSVESLQNLFLKFDRYRKRHSETLSAASCMGTG
jgi:hypothetical protein